MLVKVLLSLVLALSASAELRVVPEPTTHSEGNTTLCLAPNFKIAIEGGSGADDLLSAAKEVTRRLSKSTALPSYLSPTHGSEFLPCQATLSRLVLRINDGAQAKPIASHAQERLESRTANEMYNLTVPVGGDAIISAGTSIGLFRGLTTFENLFYASIGGDKPANSKARGASESGVVYAPFAPYSISDKPAFAWRAVLLDSSRHFLPVDVIKRQLDAMAAVKLNVFHWHIVDSQSFPLKFEGELKVLANKAAYSPSKVYSEADVRDIVAYAGARGIDVVMEIDTPGHTAYVHEVYPDLVAGYVQHPWGKWANEPPSGQLRFADPATISFTQDMFIAAARLVKSPYFGTGGDEINAVCVSNDTKTQQIYKDNGWPWNFTDAAASDATLSAALKPFTQQTHQTLRDLHRTPVVWDEMAIEFDTGIGNDTLVQAWRGPESTAKVIAKGFRVIMADYNYFYLDCGQGGWVTGNPDTTVTRNIDSWCHFATWMKAINYNPYANLTSEAERQLVVGGQASLWAEQTDASNIEGQLWPRAAAFAEVFWSGGGVQGFPRNATSALPRIHDIRYRLEARGFRAIPIQPEWCALRPGECNLE